MGGFRGMTASEAAAIVRWLDDRGVVYQVNGGWAVDALVGRQTRLHGDLDVFVDSARAAELSAWLVGRGYEVAQDWFPIRVEYHAGDFRVDVHPMDLEATGDGVQQGFAGEVFVHKASERTIGTIGGDPVVVATPERLLELRSGYELRAEDEHDIALLRGLRL